jgi:hypothetical protein
LESQPCCLQEKWYQDCEEELRKITAFYQEKRAEADRRLLSLKASSHSTDGCICL